MTTMKLFHRGVRNAYLYGSMTMVLLGILIIAIPSLLEYVVALILIGLGSFGLWLNLTSKKKFF